VRLLLDTHLLIWSAEGDEGLTGIMPASAANLIDDPASDLVFSVASLWEVAIKSALNKPGFRVEPSLLRRSLLDNGYKELSIQAEHALAAGGLPALHKDPFDRMLIAQARLEGLLLLTADAQIAAYSGPIRKV
jgi:PIN domain nuclease of toxin-antitoxin system